MRRKSTKVVITLLHILAIITFRASKTKKSLLKDRIYTIPERGSEAKAALSIGESEKSVLAPPICSASGMIVGEVTPTGPVGRVILSHGPPLSIG
jgi:hypothetical protein